MSRDNYIEVNERIQTFIEAYPSGSLQGEWSYTQRDGETWLVYKALAYRTPDDQRPGMGYAWEPIPGRTSFTKGSELMNGETSAWGRAIAALGIAVQRGIASGSEIRNADARRIDTVKATPVDDEWYAPDHEAPPIPDELSYTRSVDGPLARALARDPASPKQLGMIKGKCRDLGVTDRAQIIALINQCLASMGDKPITSSGELTKATASKVIEVLSKPPLSVDEWLVLQTSEDAP